MQLQLPATFDNTQLTTTFYNLCRTLLKVWLFTWPLAFPVGMAAFKYWRIDAGIATRIRLWFGLGRAGRPAPSPYSTFSDAAEEEEYWRSSERVRRVLQASDANTTPATIPLIRYYVPKLLPTYRDTAEEDLEATEVYVASKTFCKWHRMVFPGPMHPTVKEAKEHIKCYSSRDRREILRMGMARVFSDEGGTCEARYAKMWKWLGTKGPDLAIVFE